MFAVPLLALALPSAHAFCGTYVGPAGASLANRTSSMVVVRQGDRTTVTMAGDVRGAVPSLGMLVPVPGDVQGARVLDDLSLLERVDRYAGPRLVSYGCEDLERQGLGQQACGAALDRATQWATDAALDHASAALGDAVLGEGRMALEVLAPSSVADLADWAGAHGWQLDAAAAELLDATIAPDTRFLAVTVDLDEALAGAAWTRPIQFSYRSSALSVPLALGALHSPGVQDVVVHVITDADAGTMGISNYPEFSVEAECMVRDASALGLDDFYADAVQAAFEESGGQAAWTTEYAWAPAKCDPCPAEGPLDEQVLADLGFDGDPTRATLTRLRARLRPEAVRGDLALYASGITGQQQLRYVVHADELEQDWPVCGEGWVEGGGACPVDSGDPAPAGLPALPAGALLALAGVAARRRG